METRHRSTAVLATTLAVLLWPAGLQADSTRFGIDAGYDHYSNVNRAALDREEQSDDSVSLEAHAARSFLLSDRSGIVLRGGVKTKEFFEFGDLSSLGLSGRAAWRYQPTPGFTSPWIELAAGLEAFRFRDSEIRDGGLATVSASVGKYFTDRIRLEGGAGYERRFASEGEIFDLGNAKLWASLDYKLTSSTTFYGSATWLKGDQVFTLNNTASWGSLYTYAGAAAPDPVFASAFGGSTPMAYRVEATTWVYDVGANIAITGNQALDFGASYFRSEADQGDGRYDGATFRAAYLYRFR